MESKEKGWLWKQGGKVKNWKHRYFVLHNSYLEYFETDKEAQALGSIPLGMVVCYVPFKNETERQFSFALQTPDRSYYISAESEADMKRWVDAIKANIRDVFLQVNQLLPTAQAYADPVEKRGNLVRGFSKRILGMKGDKPKDKQDKQQDKPQLTITTPTSSVSTLSDPAAANNETSSPILSLPSSSPSPARSLSPSPSLRTRSRSPSPTPSPSLPLAAVPISVSPSPSPSPSLSNSPTPISPSRKLSSASATSPRSQTTDPLTPARPTFVPTSNVKAQLSKFKQNNPQEGKLSSKSDNSPVSSPRRNKTENNEPQSSPPVSPRPKQTGPPLPERVLKSKATLVRPPRPHIKPPQHPSGPSGPSGPKEASTASVNLTTTTNSSTVSSNGNSATYNIQSVDSLVINNNIVIHCAPTVSDNKLPTDAKEGKRRNERIEHILGSKELVTGNVVKAVQKSLSTTFQMEGAFVDSNIFRRFKQFDELDGNIGSCIHPDFTLPSKTLTHKFGGEFVEKRREELDKYIQGCCQRSEQIMTTEKGRKYWFKFVKPAQLGDARGDSFSFDIFATPDKMDVFL